MPTSDEAPTAQEKRTPLAWVESPLQLLCAIEYAAAGAIALRIVPRAGATQLAETVTFLERMGLPTGVVIERPRSAVRAAVMLLASPRWVAGDAFSAVVRAVLAMRRPASMVVVDDGALTLRLAEVLAGSAPLERPERPEVPAVRLLARRARHNLRAVADAGRLLVFSFYPLATAAHVAHRFDWLRSQFITQEAPPAVILGTAAVVDGRMTEAEYLRWLGVQRLPATYFPHRRETPAALERVARVAGITVRATGLPIELVLAGARGVRIASLPTSALDTLAIILEGRDCELPTATPTATHTATQTATAATVGSAA